MGTWGTGPFSSDGALDLLDELAGQPASQRREALERIFSGARNRPDLLGRKFFPDEIVAAAAVLAASLPGGEGPRQNLADHGYDVDALLVPAPDPELNHSALEALQVAAGPHGPWHDGWTGPQAAAQARQTTDRLAAILRRGGAPGAAGSRTVRGLRCPALAQVMALAHK
jgi:alpha-glucosidase